MKRKTIETILVLFISLIGCSNDNSSENTNLVFISVIGITGDTGFITEVNRNSVVSSVVAVKNNTNEIFTGFVEVYINTTCEGLTTWVIRDTQQIEINPGTTSAFITNSTCSDLNASITDLVGNVYGPDQIEIIDTDSYTFTIN